MNLCLRNYVSAGRRLDFGVLYVVFYSLFATVLDLGISRILPSDWSLACIVRPSCS